jgi:hypothetical protein
MMHEGMNLNQELFATGVQKKETETSFLNTKQKSL